jgi:hypothetical protein
MCTSVIYGRRCNRSRLRSGITSLEIVVASGIILATASLLTTLSFKCGMIWRDVSAHRLAVAELSSHLEKLTVLDREELAEQLVELKLSKLCQKRLKNAAIAGSLSEDNLGVRIRLQLDWDRGHASKPVSLTGWLIESESEQ